MRSARVSIFVAGILTLFAVSGIAQTGRNVLVVINEKSPASVQIGEYYAQRRSVPADHIVRIDAPVSEVVNRADYARAIEGPIGLWIRQHDLEDEVLYLVLTKGVPLRITGTVGLDGTGASVDSELTLLYRKLLQLDPPVVGHVPNPYYLADQDPSKARPFSHASSDIYLVTRLDGFSVDDVRHAIDRALSPTQQGVVLLDEMAAPNGRGGDAWLKETDERFRLSGASDRVRLETTTAVAVTKDPVLGYFSWGSTDPSNRLRKTGLTFVDGAIGGLFVGTDGRTFLEPPAGWTPGPQSAGSQWGTQSLAGDLIRDGLTGVSADVAEPYLDAVVRPQILFPVYLGGMNLAEAYYLAMPYLSWQTIVLGDPLCAPFRTSPLAPQAIARGLDPRTDLPGYFSDRRLAVVKGGDLNEDALAASIRSEVELLKGDHAGAEASLERATTLEPRLGREFATLGQLYEADGQFDKAVDRYRKAVGVDPQNLVALNNLAYALATRENRASEALPLAERAYAIAPTPGIADTLAWIEHLTGDDRSAAVLLEQASAAAPSNVDLLVHSAVVHAALNDKVTARQALAAADKLDSHLDDRPGVKALREQLKGGG